MKCQLVEGLADTCDSREDFCGNVKGPGHSSLLSKRYHHRGVRAKLLELEVGLVRGPPHPDAFSAESSMQRYLITYRVIGVKECMGEPILDDYLSRNAVVSAVPKFPHTFQQAQTVRRIFICATVQCGLDFRDKSFLAMLARASHVRLLDSLFEWCNSTV